MTKIFIDDIRNPPDDSWTVFRTTDEALAFIIDNVTKNQNDFFDSPIEEISFDHDMGGESTTRPIALWLEEQAFHCLGDGTKWFCSFDFVTRIHSANPVGRAWLSQSLKKSTNFRED